MLRSSNKPERGRRTASRSAGAGRRSCRPWWRQESVLTGGTAREPRTPSRRGATVRPTTRVLPHALRDPVSCYGHAGKIAGQEDSTPSPSREPPLALTHRRRLGHSRSGIGAPMGGHQPARPQPVQDRAVHHPCPGRGAGWAAVGPSRDHRRDRARLSPRPSAPRTPGRSAGVPTRQRPPPTRTNGPPGRRNPPVTSTRPNLQQLRRTRHGVVPGCGTRPSLAGRR